MILVDSHCHLDMLSEYDSVDNILARADEAGVKYMQTICTRLDNFNNIITIAKKFPNVYASVGVHPSEVESVVSHEELTRLSSDPKVIGLGETGLDYFYNKDQEQQKMQRDSFASHIRSAQENKLPVIIHMRDAEIDTIEMLQYHKKIQDFPALIHCFTSTLDFAKQVLDLGLYISVSGIVTFKNADALRDVVKYVPADRILVETDAPYLAPVPMRGKTNEPSYTKYVAEFIANLKNIDVDEFANLSTNNFFTLFTKAKQR